MFGSHLESNCESGLDVDMEFQMRSQISYTALGLALIAGATTANAQTVMTRQISDQPIETVITQQPVQTVRTVETVRTVRPARTAARPIARRQVITTRRTTISERVVPTRTVVAPEIAASYPQPLYDVAAPAPLATSSYRQPLYDTVVPAPPAPAFGMTPVADDWNGGAPAYNTPVASPVPTYRYVYEPDRILVIDPTTNIAIQALPR
jgi:hypothetical protein